MDTLENFTEVKNGEQVRSINYSSSLHRSITEDSTSPPELVTTEEVKNCLRSCPNVENISLSWDVAFSLNRDKTLYKQLSDIIDVLSQYAKNIKFLCIVSRYLNDNHLKVINNHNFPKLEKLFLTRCSGISDIGVKNAIINTPTIKALDLHYSISLNPNQAAISIGEYLPNLRYLSMHRCCDVEDSGIIAIAKGCPGLEYLDVGRNYQLSDKALQAIGQHCPQFKMIGMYYNNGVTEKGLEYLMEGCPQFKCFHYGSGWCQIDSIKEKEDLYEGICFTGGRSFCEEKHWAMVDF